MVQASASVFEASASLGIEGKMAVNRTKRGNS